MFAKLLSPFTGSSLSFVGNSLGVGGLRLPRLSLTSLSVSIPVTCHRSDRFDHPDCLLSAGALNSRIVCGCALRPWAKPALCGGTCRIAITCALNPRSRTAPHCSPTTVASLCHTYSPICATSALCGWLVRMNSGVQTDHLSP